MLSSLWLALAGAAGPTAAQPGRASTPWCASDHAADAARTGSAASMPLAGEVRALLVFVRFPDDTRTGDGCSRGLRHTWPVGADLPHGADAFLASTPGGPAPDSSLTTLYRLASQGAFDLYGTTIGYVTREPEDAYFLGSSSNLNRSRLTREILEDLTAQGIRLSEYDANADGILDQLIVVVRSFASNHGITQCTRQGNQASCASGTAELGVVDSSDLGIFVSSSSSGQYNVYQNIEPHHDLVGLVAHELGHHLWGARGLTAVHLEPVLDNGIPAGDADGAMALMLGSGPMYAKTAFPSAGERLIVSSALPEADRWLTCDVPEPGRTYELGDTFATNECLQIRYGPPCTGCAPSSLVLSGLYRETPFEQARSSFSTISAACPGCVRVENGLPATGVMLELLHTLPGGATTRDLFPADLDLTTFQGCDLIDGVGATAEEVYGGDLWTPASARALNPFTHPNIYGYASLGLTPRSVYLTPGAVPHELSGFRTGPDGRVAFDYRTDLLERDSLVADGGWSFGPQFGPLAFDAFHLAVPGDVEVLDDTDLTLGRMDLRLARSIQLGNDVRLTTDEILWPPPGTLFRLTVGEGVEVSLPGSRTATSDAPIQVAGTLTIGGDLTVSGDDGALSIEQGGRLEVAGNLVLETEVPSSRTAQIIVGGDLIVAPGTPRLLLRGEVQVGGRLVIRPGTEFILSDTARLEVAGPVSLQGTLFVGSTTGAYGATMDLPSGMALAPGAVLSVARLSSLETGGPLVIPGGASLLTLFGSVLSVGGDLLAEPGSVVQFGGRTVRLAPAATATFLGATRFTGVPGSRMRFEATDPSQGWGGMVLSGDTTRVTGQNLVVADVVGAPALRVLDRSISVRALDIESPQATGGLAIDGAPEATLRDVGIAATTGIGLDVRGGSVVELAPPVRILGHRGTLRVDSSQVVSRCTADQACAEPPHVFSRNTAASDGFDLELRRRALVRLPHTSWPVEDARLLVIVGDGTGRLEVEPLASQFLPPDAPEPEGEPLMFRVGFVTPNPTADRLTVQVETPVAADTRLAVYDVLGRRVLESQRALEPGRYPLSLSAGGLAPGTYVLHVDLDLGSSTRRTVRPFVVVR